MNLLSLIVVLLVVGAILYFINHYAPLDPPVKQMINFVVIMVLIIWIIEALFPGLGTINLGPLRRGG